VRRRPTPSGSELARRAQNQSQSECRRQPKGRVCSTGSFEEAMSQLQISSQHCSPERALGPCHRRAHLGVSLLGSLHLAFDVRDPRFPANSNANKQSVRASLAKGRMACKSLRVHPHIMSSILETDLESFSATASLRSGSVSLDIVCAVCRTTQTGFCWPQQLTAAALRRAMTAAPDRYA
jgi:hypothetical protein